MKKKSIIVGFLLVCLLALPIVAYADTTYTSTIYLPSNSTLEGATRSYTGKYKYIAITPDEIYSSINASDVYVALYRVSLLGLKEEKVASVTKRLDTIGEKYVFSMGTSKDGKYNYFFSTTIGPCRDGFHSNDVIMRSFD